MDSNNLQQEELSVCEFCELPADGLDQIHCQLHWEEVCSYGFWKQIQEMYVGVQVEDE